MHDKEKTQKTELSLLDRPILGGIRLDWWMMICVLIIVLAMGTRLWDLAWRAYCHDESIHASWSWDLYTGKGYRHNPVYHGPFYYHLTAFAFFLFGDSDTTGRLPAAIFGVATVILVLYLRKWLGRWGTLAAIALMTLSPIMMHRSRYIRDDPWPIVFEIILFIAILFYMEKRQDKYLYVIAAAMSLAFASKETAFIYQAIFGSFLFFFLLFRLRRNGKESWRKDPIFDLVVLIGTLILPLASPFPIKLLGFDPTDYSTQGIVRSGIIFLIVLGISAAIGLWWDRRRWLISAGIFYLIFISLFTTMFTNGQGFATGMIGSLGYWLQQQEVKRGGQPWFYYFLLIPMYDFLVLLFSLLGAGYALKKFMPRRAAAPEAAPRQVKAPAAELQAPFIPFVLYWIVLSWIMYTWAGEKMPWIASNIIPPMVLLAGWFIGQVFERIDWVAFRARSGWVMVVLIPLFLTVLITVAQVRPFQGTSLDQLGDTMRWLACVVVGVGILIAFYYLAQKLGGEGIWHSLFLATLIVLSAFTIRYAWMISFQTGDLASELMVYAQGTPDVPLVMQEITDMSQRLTGGLDLKVAYDDESSWPFVWYLRNFKNAQYFAKKPGAPFDAAVVIVGLGNEAAAKPFLGNKYLRREYKLIWWPTEAYKDLTLSKVIQGIGDPAARQNFWNVIFYRKYTYGLNNWPHVNRFAMYVRRDVAAQLWDYGPEVIVQEVEAPGEEYEKKLRQVAAIQTIGGEGAGNGQLRSPKGVAFDSTGNLYVTDSQNHRIVKFSAAGQFIAQWGSQGNQPGQLNEPWAVAVDKQGYIFVADTWNHRIQRFSPQGQFEKAWGVFGDIGATMPGKEDLLYGPRDIVIDAEGNLYVSDTGNKRIIKFDRDGKYLGQWGGLGAGDGQFVEPVGIAIDASGNFYVADTWNRRIQKFDKSFRYVAQWPVAGWEGESVVNKPYIAADAEGNVYITDPEQYRVIKFDAKGAVLAVWGQFGTDLNSLNLPTGLKLDKDGNIYVADSSNHRILKYGPVK